MALQPQGSTRSPIRGVIFGGLLILFVLWIVTGVELLRNLAEGEKRVSELHAAFIRGEDALTAIRTSVLLGSIFLRDALVDTTGSRQQYRDELRRFRRDIERRVTALADDPILSTAGGELQPLRSALDQYWETLDVFLGPDAPQTFIQGTGVLRRQVVPARTNVLSVIDRITDLQRTAQRQREADASALYGEVRLRFIAIGIATLLISAAASGFVLFRVARLERELDERRAIEAQNRRDLERLSARLVDAQEEERRALARELHDEVGQALTALKMEIGVAIQCGGTSPRLAGALQEAKTIADTTLHGVRDLSQILHPSVLDDFGLPEAVHAYVRSFSKRTGIRTELQVEPLEHRLPAGVELTVYRIIQEALTNVARHSRARTCSVTLTRREDVLHMCIEDDGDGIGGDANAPVSRGLGVIGMRERAQSLAGSFAIERPADGGTRVSVTIPVARVRDVVAAG